MNLLRNFFSFIFKKNSKNKEIESLKMDLAKLSDSKIEDYLGDKILIDTSNGFQVRFLGETIVRILSRCFWYLVKDSDNYLIFTFKDHDNGTGVDVILVKEGHLTPIEELERLQEENDSLKEKLSKYSKF